MFAHSYLTEPSSAFSILEGGGGQELTVKPHVIQQEDDKIADLIPVLRAFARTFYRDSIDADDLVQDTLLTGIANIGQFQPGTRMKSWLFTIMRNTFCTRLRTDRERRGLLECVCGGLATLPGREWIIPAGEVELAIHRLPQQHREVLVLIGVAGVSYDEAAQILECSIGTIKSRLNRARANLLVELGEGSTQSLLEARGHIPPGPESTTH